MSSLEQQTTENNVNIHWPPTDIVNSGTGNFPSWTTYSLAASQLLHDVNEKSHFETLTEAKSLRANLRIAVSGHNEPVDAALTAMHRLDWTTIKQETMARQTVRTAPESDKVGRHFGEDKEDTGEQVQRDGDDMTNGNEYTDLHLYAHRDLGTVPPNDDTCIAYYSKDIQGEQSSEHQMSPWLQHLSMLSSGPLFDVHQPYMSAQTQLVPTDLRVPAKQTTFAHMENYRARGRKMESAQRSSSCHTVSRLVASKRSSRSGRGHGPLSKEQQRRNACVRERTRMRDMNLAFDTLRDRLPYIRQHGKRISKIEALRLTIKYIKQLKAILHDARNNSYINELN